MKTFLKRSALVCGVLFTALLCMGIVYIDNTKHYFYVAGGHVQMWVNTNFVFNVQTNTGRVGFGQTNTVRAFVVSPLPPPTNSTGNGASAATTGSIALTAGTGGGTFATTTASGGTGGGLVFTTGAGGVAPVAQTNNTGGAGGSFSIVSGNGGASSASALATNSATGGPGGSAAFTSGAGGAPATPATNTVGGDGGSFNLTSSGGGTPSAGWSRKGGNGGTFLMAAGAGGNSTRTNGGTGGSMVITAGNAGSASTAPGDAGISGNVELTAGDGANGTSTNSNGGRIHLVGGIPGTGATAGDVVVARTSGGSSRGGLMVGPLLGGAVSITNILGASAALDFPSTAAGAVSDLPITVTGVTSNNCAVAMSVAWQALTAGGGFDYFNSNDTVYIRFVNNNLVTAIDPPPFTATVVAFRIR